MHELAHSCNDQIRQIIIWTIYNFFLFVINTEKKEKIVKAIEVQGFGSLTTRRSSNLLNVKRIKKYRLKKQRPLELLPTMEK